MTDPTPLDRRPLASRGWSVSSRAATWLAARGVTPNAISIAGMISGILAGAAFAATAHGPLSSHPIAIRLLWLLAALFMQGRLIANLLDGMVAVEQNRASAVGELYNEVPDRVSDAFILAGAGYALGSCPALGFTAAILAVSTAYIRAVGKSLTGTSDYRGPMAKQQRMALLTGYCLIALLLPASWWIRPAAFPLLSITLTIMIIAETWTVIRRLRGIAATLNSRAGSKP